MLRDYFQLDICYKELFTDWSEKDEVFKEACQSCAGICILNQDPLEALIAFISSSNNNISRISSMMNRLCRHFGTFLCNYQGVEFYTFPTIETLADPSVKTTLRELGFGYRAKHVNQAAQYILKNHSKDWIYNLHELDYNEIWKLLQNVPGIGPKVADCICLMGLKKSEAVPIDTHMRQIAVRHYGLKDTGRKSISLALYKQIG